MVQAPKKTKKVSSKKGLKKSSPKKVAKIPKSKKKNTVKKIKAEPRKEPLAVGQFKKKIFLLYREYSNTKETLHMAFSGRSGTFDGDSHKVSIVDSKNKKEDTSRCSHFRFSSDAKNLVLTYIKNSETGSALVSAQSSTGKKWIITDTITHVKTAGSVVWNDKGTPVIYFGDHVLKIARPDEEKSKTKTAKPAQKTWHIVEPPRTPHWHFFDGVPFSVSSSLVLADYIAVFYSAIHTVDILRDVNLHNEKVGEERLLKIGVAMFSKKDPTRLLWQTELPIIEVPLETDNTLTVLGVVSIPEKSVLRMYTYSADGHLGSIDLPYDIIDDHKNRKQTLLKRWHKNPILSPSHLEWENDGAFNPAALYLNNAVHLLYRAVGSDGYSSIGYARHTDGLHLDQRLKKPAYSPKFWFEKSNGKDTPKDYSLFASGGSWGGCEDPKVTKIDDRIYMTYVAHTGVWPMRTVLTSISVDDFLQKKWRWTRSQLMSAPGIGSKSVVILPEKVNDMYYIFHRMWPNIMVDIVPDLDFGEGKRYLKVQKMIRPRKSFWDSQKLSMGAAPIKTKDGWLAIYSAVDRLDSSKYKIGAMLLDLNDPAKVLARSRKPILSPEEPYENDGKPGVVYPGGVVNINGILHVYYGGGDKVSCVAQIPVDQLVEHLKKDSEPQMHITNLGKL